MNGGVVGLDLSLTATGMAHVNHLGDPVELGLFGTKGKRSATLHDRADRLELMAESIVDWTLAGEGPELVVVEAPSYGSQGGSAHDRSGLWWLVVHSIRSNGIPVVEVPPRTRAKYLTGNGNADKALVMDVAQKVYAPLLPADQVISKDDLADALGLASMGSRHLGRPVEPYRDWEAKSLEAMEAVAWPLET